MTYAEIVLAVALIVFPGGFLAGIAVERRFADRDILHARRQLAERAAWVLGVLKQARRERP